VALGLRPPLPAGPWLVVGLARSGVAAARVLHARGETVVGVDAGRPDVDLPAGVEVHLGADGSPWCPTPARWSRAPASRRTPRSSPPRAPRASPCSASWSWPGACCPTSRSWPSPAPTAGRPRSSGSATSTGRAALPVVAGNVGTALTSLVGTLTPGTVVVCAASPSQLRDTSEFAPEVAVLLDVAQDDLDRHGTMDDPLASTLRVFAAQATTTWPWPRWTPASRTWAAAPSASASGWGWTPTWPIGPGSVLVGRRAAAGRRRARRAWRARPRERDGRRGGLPVDGVDVDAVRRGLMTFAGVRHRREEVATWRGVTYVDDSGATEVGATVVALATCSRSRST